MTERAQCGLKVAIVVPGHRGSVCGITDYGFWLARAGVANGAQLMLIGLTDMRVLEDSYRAKIPVEYADLFQCRDLSRAEDKYSSLVALLRQFEADVVSLQFDPLMFREGKFFVFSMLRFRRSIPKSTPLLVTVHETADVLLAGTDKPKRLLQKFREWECSWGLRAMRAKRYFASTAEHIRTLSEQGLSVEKLPIVNNIPRVENVEEVQLAGLADDAEVALLFGRIDPTWNAAPVLDSLRVEYGEKLVVISAGEVGYRGEGWRRLEALAGEIPCFKLGFISAEALSGWLSRARVGIATTVFTLWPKSGSCAAMIEHDLPMVFPEGELSVEISWPPKFAMPSSEGLRWFDTPEAKRAKRFSARDIWTSMFRIENENNTGTAA